MSGTPHALKHGDSFAVFGADGTLQGLFHRDTRHLATLQLSVDGAVPLPSGTWQSEDNIVLLTALRHENLAFSRARFVWRDCLYERLQVRNAGDAVRRVTLEIAFAADFADLFEVRGHRRERRGTRLPAPCAADRVTLAYRGLDGRDRTTCLVFDPPPARLDDGVVRFELEFGPRASCSLFLAVTCVPQSPLPFFDALREARSGPARAAALSGGDPALDRVLTRSVTDLYTLVTELPEGPYPYAGLPWYSTVFGRDALIAALQALWLDPAIARGVLLHLAAHQATAVDPARDAEPGKILHEQRQGEMAATGEVPFARYYGSIDATPLFVMLAGEYLRRTGDVATLRHLWPALRAALAWIARHGDGFVAYLRRADRGLRNQGWKDSPDSIFHADGALAEGPIALCEVQACAYAAWRAASDIARRLGEPADAYDARADGLRRAFDTHFFDASLGTYVLALDGEGRACRVRASNAGHALFAGIAYPERAASVVRTLMEPRSFSGWGIRTVAEGEARYDPASYHNGSIWPHDTGLIAAGFARYGFHDEAASLFEAMTEAAGHFDRARLPELFSGAARVAGQGPTPYPGACSPQAWAAGAPLMLLQACRIDVLPPEGQGDRT
ncbi:MAG: glycogen debranching N-terminal domain-containing protein [Reyranellaceae bacterium]